jgi:shikimate dehydrogenase
VIGDPVRHSLSPALHNAAFAALGLDWVYVAFAVAAGHGAAAVAAMRALDIAGLSVTMPHKAAVVAELDRLGPTATLLGVVNTISWTASPDGWELEGESTDGAGFIDALRGDDGFDPAGRRCVVLGSGGAARSVTLALAEAGSASVQVVARRRDAAVQCSGLAGPIGFALVVPGEGPAGAAGAGEAPAGPGAGEAPESADPVARSAGPGAGEAPESADPVARPADAVAGLSDAVAGADLIVNATPVGMAAGDGLPFDLDPELLHQGQFVADLIYAPATTPLLAAARVRGAGTANGLGTLIHQAARQVAIWTGNPAPLEAMSAAALLALSQRQHLSRS